MDSKFILYRILFIIPTVLSLSVHEWAHAYSASKLGDDTAERQGRLTLNPLVHIDPMGTILLPLLGIPFGWARPVPVNPTKFTRNVSMRTGMALTAAAGPISNFVLAVVCAVLYGLLLRFQVRLGAQTIPVFLLLGYSIQLNIGLGLFNLLPVPPLDGSRIAYRFMAHRFPRFWALLERYSRFALIAVFLAGGMILAKPRMMLERATSSVIVRIAGAHDAAVYDDDP